MTLNLFFFAGNTVNNVKVPVGSGGRSSDVGKNRSRSIVKYESEGDFLLWVELKHRAAQNLAEKCTFDL